MTTLKSSRALYAEAEQAAMERIRRGEPLRKGLEARVDAETDEETFFIDDVIGGWFGLLSGEIIRAVNASTAKTIHLHINSPGGDVFDAEAIQTALQAHPARVVAHIDGLAASAATTIAMAADEIEMSDGAFFMIHNAWGMIAGGADDLLDYAALLEKVNANIRADYARRTGKSVEDVRAWMDAETWFNAEEAMENGFIDSIFTPEDAKKCKNEAKNEENTAKVYDSTDSLDNISAKASRERRLALLAVA